VRSASWLDRKQIDDLNHSLPIGPDSILETVEYLQQTLEPIVTQLLKPSSDTEEYLSNNDPLIRQWLYLISLSTKSKRNDIVAWAPEFDLTGFVMAGKPGLLCLEGTLKNIDRYISKIKSISWSDVPSHQKKISIVLQEDIQNRIFSDITEITELFDMHGFRQNRPEMTQVRDWLTKQGLGYAFSTV
ncbi:hypothetical protein BC833DRAFT_508890, partial [Globomyces pollinis-pini]